MSLPVQDISFEVNGNRAEVKVSPVAAWSGSPGSGHPRRSLRGSPRGRSGPPGGREGLGSRSPPATAELGPRRATYVTQVQLYADAIARATGERAEALLLVV